MQRALAVFPWRASRRTPAPPSSYLLDVSFASIPPARSQTNAGKASFTPASTLRFVIPYLPRAPRPRTPPPTRMHTAPQLPSPETAPPPRAGGLASHARRRRSALRPRRRRPQPSGGLHARRSHPATHTGCLASPKHTGCPFLHAAPPQTLDLEHRRSPLLYVLYSTPTRPFSPPPLQHSTLPKPWT